MQDANEAQRVDSDAQRQGDSSGVRMRIVVAAHEPCWVPDDPLYLPVQAGAALHEPIPGFQPDDQGPNISDRNQRYSELTALYWAWKNLDADAVGLAHYRRHFAGAGEQGVITQPELLDLLLRAPVVLPRRRNYYIETIESHYAHTCDGAHLDILREEVGRLEPDYLPTFERHLAQSKTHICNMLIAYKPVLDAYCSWLFPILDAVDARIDWRSLTPYHARAVGRVAEYLLDVWLSVQGIPYVEVPMRTIGPQRRAARAWAFLAAKFFGKKYG